jgi:hypothetical protein
VHFNADFVLQIPVELSEAPVLEVSNRGSRGLVSMFNLASRGPHATLEEAFGDTRPTIDSLYAGREDFLQRTGVALDALIGEGFVLAEDRPRSIEDAALRWQLWADAPREGAHGNE